MLKRKWMVLTFYWIPKLHKDSYKTFHAGSAKCSTKPLSKLLTSILTTVKDGFKNTLMSFTAIVGLIKCGT